MSSPIHGGYNPQNINPFQRGLNAVGTAIKNFFLGSPEEQARWASSSTTVSGFARAQNSNAPKNGASALGATPQAQRKAEDTVRNSFVEIFSPENSYVDWGPPPPYTEDDNQRQGSQFPSDPKTPPPVEQMQEPPSPSSTMRSENQEIPEHFHDFNNTTINNPLFEPREGEIHSTAQARFEQAYAQPSTNLVRINDLSERRIQNIKEVIQRHCSHGTQQDKINKLILLRRDQGLNATDFYKLCNEVVNNNRLIPRDQRKAILNYFNNF